MYLENLLLSKELTKSLKKKFATMYRQSAPVVTENMEIKVPSHLPNNMPDNNSIGEPKPKSKTQMIANKENKQMLKIKFFPIIKSIFSCNNL